MNQTESIALLAAVALIAYTVGKNRATRTTAAAAEPQPDVLAWLGGWTQ